MLLSYGFWSYSNMRLYLTYFPLFFLTLTLTFYVKSTVIETKHTDYELNLKRKNLSQNPNEVLQMGKIKVFLNTT
jgi:hypothetical protein